ncbi:uncharacterized protein EI90DRAFT_3031070 [Cantharellus anzutake]|uniref:uncharacterized protein n=1 Tax=Cantharellus anzutake TaxID=1750568 RepID=UPI00190479FA|nr:uncharacterized protein EI90DRAFT_3031070 [Cantharellus anzutake]KAF8343017.1 hypothetical protein EI90DRAFT_3031070 [Cantharellus anzutake]
MMQPTFVTFVLASFLPTSILGAPISNTLMVNVESVAAHRPNATATSFSDTSSTSTFSSHTSIWTRLTDYLPTTSPQHHHSSPVVDVVATARATRTTVFHHANQNRSTAQLRKNQISHIATKASPSTNIGSVSFYLPAPVPPSILFFPTKTPKLEASASSGTGPDALTTSAADPAVRDLPNHDWKLRVVLACLVSSTLVLLSGILFLVFFRRVRGICFKDVFRNLSGPAIPQRPLTHGEWCAGEEEHGNSSANGPGDTQHKRLEISDHGVASADGVLHKDQFQPGSVSWTQDLYKTGILERPFPSLDRGNFAIASRHSPPDVLGMGSAQLMAEVSAAFAFSETFLSSSPGAKSMVSSAPPPRNPSQVQPTAVIESVRGSIEERFSFLGSVERASISGSVLDSMAYSTNSGRSPKSFRTRFDSRKNWKSPFSSPERPKSTISQIGQDVAVLFSGSEESMFVGVPSAPPPSSNEIASAPKLEQVIPAPPMPFPEELLADTPSLAAPLPFELATLSTPYHLRKTTTHLSQTESQGFSAAIRLSLLFDPSLNILPPASPSSDGVMASSANSTLSCAKGTPRHSLLLSLQSLHSSGASHHIDTGGLTQTRSLPSFGDLRTSSSVDSSPEKHCAAVFAQISKSSLDLEAAIKALESDNEGTPPTTPRSSPSHSVCSRLSPFPAPIPVITFSPPLSFPEGEDVPPSDEPSIFDMSTCCVSSQSSETHLLSGESSLTAVEDFASGSDPTKPPKILSDILMMPTDESITAHSAPSLSLSTSVGAESTLSSDPSAGEIQSFSVSRLSEARAIVVRSSDGRLMQSVIPVLDPEMAQLDEWMRDIVSEGESGPDDDDGGSFEGLPEHTSAIHLAQADQAFLILENHWDSWAHINNFSHPDYRFSESRDIEESVYDGITYLRNRDSLSYANRIRAGEVAFRALEREGRFTEGETLIRRLEILRARADRSVPMAPSPLRFERRVSALSTATSEKSIYSQRSENVEGLDELPHVY